MGENWSPRATARLAGLLYFINALGGLYAEVFARGRVLVSGNAAATAANLVTHETLFRSGLAADLITMLCEVGIALLFFQLFRGVSRNLAVLMVVFRLLWVAVFSAVALTLAAPLLLLTGRGFAALPAGQAQALSFLFMRLHAQGYLIALVFFGVECLLVGALIWRATFLPKILGALMALAGVLYLVNSFGALLAPAATRSISLYILIPCAIAEWALTLWLLIAGVDSDKWRAQNPQLVSSS